MLEIRYILNGGYNEVVSINANLILYNLEFNLKKITKTLLIPLSFYIKKNVFFIGMILAKNIYWESYTQTTVTHTIINLLAYI